MALPEHPEDAERPPPKVAHVLWVGLGLVVLTLATWLLARLPHGAWSVPVALLIAGAKAALVAAVFMELGWRRGGTQVMVAVALVLAGVLVLLSALETARRFPPVIPPGPFGALEVPAGVEGESVAPNRRAPGGVD